MRGTDPEFQGTVGVTYRDSKPWWAPPRTAPRDAPNVVCVVLDDVGFSDLGCYGAEIATPQIDALAAAGLRYSNFHVTAMCSPTRACLLTGRNAHAVGVGIIAEWSSGFPGYQGFISRRAATVPEVLRDHGYGTYAIGKWHLTNIGNYGAAGPHDDWPLGRGFSRWYGFHGALTNQWNPELCRDNRPIQLLPRRDRYHLSEDLVDHAIGDVRDHVTAAADPTSSCCTWPSAPVIGRITCPTSTSAAIAGDMTKDGTKSAPRGSRSSCAWASCRRALPCRRSIRASRRGTTSRTMSGDWPRACRRRTPASSSTPTRRSAGWSATLRRSASLDNTIIVLLSDNGASAEGGRPVRSTCASTWSMKRNRRSRSRALDRLGSEHTYNHYPTGWAQVSNTPLKWYKKDARRRHPRPADHPLATGSPREAAFASSSTT